MKTNVPRLFARLERILDRWDPNPAASPSPGAESLARFNAFRWEAASSGGKGRLTAVAHPDRMNLDDLIGIDRAKETLIQNTRQFAAGHRANNALLWGARGTGKSSLVKAVAERFKEEGVKIVEVHREELFHLPEIVALLRAAPYRFLLFCDDLSFEPGEGSYKALKAALEGGIEARPENMLLYATSNRRHLMPREFSQDKKDRAGVMHPGERVEEEISLSDRFGLWLGFHPVGQEGYLAIVNHYAKRHNLNLPEGELRERAIDWARTRGAQSGRVARQFIDDLMGKLALDDAT